MDPHTDVTMPEGDLPMVRHGLPWPLRVAFGMLGVFAVVMPVWELGRGLWPLSIATPVFAIIIGGAASIGIAMLRAVLAGESQVWTFPPQAVVIHHRAWRSEREMRLAAHNIAAHAAANTKLRCICLLLSSVYTEIIGHWEGEFWRSNRRTTILLHSNVGRS